MTTLVCHTGKEPFFTEGTAYEVNAEDDYAYTIFDDEGDIHLLTKFPDCDGFSFVTYMTLKGE